MNKIPSFLLLTSLLEGLTPCDKEVKVFELAAILRVKGLLSLISDEIRVYLVHNSKYRAVELIRKGI